MFNIFRSCLLLFSIIALINAFLTVEDKEILDGSLEPDNLYQCESNVIYDQKLLQIDDNTINKNFIVLLHPNITDQNSTLFKTAQTFLQSIRCYFGNITFQYITFQPHSQNSSYDVNNAMCDAFDRLSDRDARSLNPLVVVFPPTKSRLLMKSTSSNVSNQANPPCTQFKTIAMTIQATILDDGFVSLFIRSKVADFVIKSVPTCQTLFDSMAVIINPSFHTEFHFPYRPIQLTQNVEATEIEKWHTAALIGIAIGFILIFVTPGIIVWRRVKAHQKQRDQDRNLREAMLKSKCEDAKV